MPRSATTLAAANAPTTAVAARQPSRSPSAAASGVPATSASELPVKTIAVARPARPGAASLPATGASTDQNTPCANAHATRAASTTGYPGARAITNCDSASSPTDPVTTRRRGSRPVSTVTGTAISPATAA